jgi:EmrB/QacA subfamily drug resistance transporter
MAGVLLGLLLGALDQTVVGPAMPKIIGDLKGFEQYSWVVTAYLLTSTISVPIFGKLSDIYGRKWFYISGIVVFMLGSMLSGLSADIYQLIVFRGLQGLGAGIMFSSAFAIVADLIPPANRGKWQGAFGAVWGLSSVIGPTVGGYITDHLSWHWVFYVNVPVGLLALAVLIPFFPHVQAHTVKRVVDWAGALTLTAGLTPLLIALSLGGTPDWDWGSAKVIGLLALAAVFLLAFIVVETKAREPIIPLDLFKNRIFTASVITVFITGVGLFGAVIYIPLFIQAIQGDTATSSGNALTPMMIAVIIGSMLSGQIISRTGRYRIVGIVGMTVVTLGMFLLYTMNMSTPRITTVAYMVIMGLGMGVTFPLYTLVTQNAFPIQRVGVVTAAVQFFRSIGSAVGVAILGSVVNNQFHAQFRPELVQRFNQLKAALPPQLAGQVDAQRFASGLNNLNPQVLVSADGVAQLHNQLVNAYHVPAPFADTIINLIKDALKPALFSGIQEAFLIGTILLAVGLISTSFLKEIPLRKSNVRGGALEGAAEWTVAEEAEEVGKEMVAAGLPGASSLPADDEPRLRRFKPEAQA